MSIRRGLRKKGDVSLTAKGVFPRQTEEPYVSIAQPQKLEQNLTELKGETRRSTALQRLTETDKMLQERNAQTRGHLGPSRKVCPSVASA